MKFLFGLATKAVGAVGALATKAIGFFGALLTGGTDVVDFSDLSDVLNSMTSQISVVQVIGIIAGVIGAGIALVFMWWGVRKLIKVLMGAFKSGKLKV